MRAEAVQTIVLCAHANAYFATAARAELDAVRLHHALRVVQGWSFDRMSGGTQVANSPSTFLTRMAYEGVASLRPLLGGLNPDPSVPSKFGFATDGDAGIETWTVSVRPRSLQFGDERPVKLDFEAGKSGKVSLGPCPGPEEPFLRLASTFESGPRTLGDFAPEFRAVRVGNATLELGPWPDMDLWPRALDSRLARKADLAIRALRFIASPLW